MHLQTFNRQRNKQPCLKGKEYWWHLKRRKDEYIKESDNVINYVFHACDRTSFLLFQERFDA